MILGTNIVPHYLNIYVSINETATNKHLNLYLVISVIFHYLHIINHGDKITRKLYYPILTKKIAKVAAQ